MDTYRMKSTGILAATAFCLALLAAPSASRAAPCGNSWSVFGSVSDGVASLANLTFTVSVQGQSGSATCTGSGCDGSPVAEGIIYDSGSGDFLLDVYNACDGGSWDFNTSTLVIAVTNNANGHCKTHTVTLTSGMGSQAITLGTTCTGGAVCGNGVKESTEVCDNTGTGTDSGCSAALPNCNGTCTSCSAAAAVCGNGTKEAAEVCDNTGSGTDAGCNSATPNCNDTCTACSAPTTTCGNGIRETGEYCDVDLSGILPYDQGCNSSFPSCNSGCTACESGGGPVVCGDGVVGGAEVCEDTGNGTDPGCTSAAPNCAGCVACGTSVCPGTLPSAGSLFTSPSPLVGTLIYQADTVTFYYSGSDAEGLASVPYKVCLDGVGAPGCSFTSQTSTTYSGLSNGTYIFSVRAVDSCGNLSPVEPCSYVNGTCDSLTFVVSLPEPNDPPDTTIVSRPNSVISTTSASFTWTGSDGSGGTPTSVGQLKFRWRLVGPGQAGAWNTASSTSSAVYSGLAQGSYTFEVKAVDNEGLEDPSPDSWSFQVDLLKPCPPTNLQAVRDSGNASLIHLTWDPAPSSGTGCGGAVTGYHIRRATSPTYVYLDYSSADGAPIGFDDESAPNCDYRYQVFGVSSGVIGEIAATAEVNDCQGCNHNGIYEPDQGEECDDGNANPWDCCTNDCKASANPACSQCPVIEASGPATNPPGRINLSGVATANPDSVEDWQWTASGANPQTAAFLPATSAETHVDVFASGEYRFYLSATAISELSDCNGGPGMQSEVVVSVPDEKPVANAGSDQVIDINTLSYVALDGKLSYDPNKSNLIYRWRIVEELSPEGGALVPDNTAQPLLLPNGVGDYTIELVVSDGLNDSLPDQVVIHVIGGECQCAPVARAGSDQSRKVGDTVTLDGASSERCADEGGAYLWTEDSANPVKDLLSSRSAARPSFVPTLPGDYRFTLQISSACAVSGIDDVVIHVEKRPDECNCDTPQADAGDDAEVSLGSTVKLSGSATSNCSITQYNWSTLLSPAGVVFSPAANVAGPSFTPTQEGNYILALTATNECNTSQPRTVEITVVDTNRPPVADAGDNQAILLDSLDGSVEVELDGTRSSDPEGQSLSFTWEQVFPDSSQPVPLLPSANVSGPRFTAGKGTYVFRLIVSDGRATDDDVVVVDISDTLPGGIVACFNPGHHTTGDEVRLSVCSVNGGREGDVFNWYQTNGPTVSSGCEDDCRTLVFTPGVGGDYCFDAVVSNGETSSLPIPFCLSIESNRKPVSDFDVLNEQGDPLSNAVVNIVEGDIIILDGTLSSDPDDDALSYQWIQEAGPHPLEFLPATTSNVIGVLFAKAGDYKISLNVNDGMADAAQMSSQEFHVEPAPANDGGGDSGGGGGGCFCAQLEPVGSPGSWTALLEAMLVMLLVMGAARFHRTPSPQRARRRRD